MLREQHMLFRSIQTTRIWNTFHKPEQHPDGMPDGPPPLLPTPTPSFTARVPVMASPMLCLGDPTTSPPPSPPFPSSPTQVPPPFFIPLLSSTQRCYYRRMIPSSQRLQQRRRQMRPSLQSSQSSKGLAGSQTPHCQLATLRAGHGVSTRSRTGSCTPRAASVSPLQPHPSFCRSLTSITTLC